MKQRDIQRETWFDLSEAAEFLGVHFTTLRRWADSGKVPFIRTPGGRRRFSIQALEQFLQGMSAVQGEEANSMALVKLEKEQAIAHTRKNIHSLSNSENWMNLLTEDQRRLLKGTGHRLMVLLLQYNSHEDGGDVFLEEGKRISREYSQICSSVGLNLKETVQIFLFFRRSVLDSIHETDHLGEKFDQTSLRLFHRTTDFMDGLLLDLIGSFPGTPARNSTLP